MDYAATTPLSEAAFLAMKPYFSEAFGNADSLHGFGGKAALALDTARREIAGLLNANREEIFFTSGGTEANNWAIKGAAYAHKAKNAGVTPHIIVSTIEHSSVLQAAEQLKHEGFYVTELPVDKLGFIDIAKLNAAITNGTCLISIMMANNEIGTVQPIKTIVAIAKKYGIPFHTDAVQAAGAYPLDVQELGVDLMTVSAHKFYGPKGIGVLYIRKSLKPQPYPLIVGGQQERTYRGGTSNIPGVVGMASAFKEASADLEKNNRQIKELRDEFVRRIESEIEGVRYNGDRESRLPQNANFSFYGIKAGELIHRLDLNGVAAASGSACSSGSVEASHVLTALGVTAEEAESAVRFSFGKFTTREDTDFAVAQIKKAVVGLRKDVLLFAHKKSKTDRV